MWLTCIIGLCFGAGLYTLFGYPGVILGMVALILLGLEGEEQ